MKVQYASLIQDVYFQLIQNEYLVQKMHMVELSWIKHWINSTCLIQFNSIRKMLIQIQFIKILTWQMLIQIQFGQILICQILIQIQFNNILIRQILIQIILDHTMKNF